METGINRSARLADTPHGGIKVISPMAGLSHDVNQHLHIIRMAISSHKLEHQLPASTEEFLTLIETQVEACVRLCQGALERSTPRELDLNSALTFIIALLDKPFQERGAKISFTPAKVRLPICLVQTDLEQIVNNLMTNALEALHPTGGIIRVETDLVHEAESDRVTSWAKLTIADDGCGIEDQIIGNIFQPHFTTKEGGHGVGLALVRQHVANADGRLQVSSRPKHGAQFHVMFRCH